MASKVVQNHFKNMYCYWYYYLFIYLLLGFVGGGGGENLQKYSLQINW